MANDQLVDYEAAELPNNQWELEVTLWFQTSLAVMQSNLVLLPVGHVASGSPFATFDPLEESEDVPDNIRSAVVSQCHNQLIQSSGQVQSFSVLGLGIVFCITAILVLLALSLERIVSILRRDSTSDGKISRQTDDKLHLLRLALGGSEKSDHAWELGMLDVPVMNMEKQFERPNIGLNGLAWY